MLPVYISVDMEGLTGAVSSEQVIPGRRDYERFRSIMAREVNAVVKGAFEAGAEGVLVNDSHDGMLNLRIEELDERAELISGYHKPLGMMQGIGRDFSCAMFVAYHSMASGPGVLSHTMTGTLSRVYLNGMPASEGVINAAVAGHFGVPVALVSGDEHAVAEVLSVCQGAVGVTVKRSIDRYSARSLSVRSAERELYSGALKALSSLGSIAPFVLKGQPKLVVEFTQPSLASKACTGGLCIRRDERTVEIEGVDPAELYTKFRAVVSLASTARDPDYG
jgi:D-amino peptidase